MDYPFPMKNSKFLKLILFWAVLISLLPRPARPQSVSLTWSGMAILGPTPIGSTINSTLLLKNNLTVPVSVDLMIRGVQSGDDVSAFNISTLPTASGSPAAIIGAGVSQTINLSYSPHKIGPITVDITARDSSGNDYDYVVKAAGQPAPPVRIGNYKLELNTQHPFEPITNFQQ